MPVDPLEYRRVMSQFATGVTVITTRTEDGVYGMTANALTSVSLDPVLVLVCFGHDARTRPHVQRSGVFAINILGKHQEDLAQLFARKDLESERTLVGMDFTVAQTGSPILPGALGYLDCKIAHQYEAGDHTIVVAEVLEAAVQDETTGPLLYFRSKYRSLAE